MTMEEYVRKLALWHTKTFKPIMNHEELEPIMAKLGFVGLPVISTTTTTSSSSASSASGTTTTSSTTVVKEYYFTAGGCRNPWPTEPLPRPRLPHPRIDGLHHLTYRAFCDAVAFYIGKRDIADHFHVRGMPLHRIHDRPFDKKFRSMGDDEVFFVYRDGTLDQATPTTICGSTSKKNSNNNTGNSNTTMGCLVSIKDIIV